MSHARRSVILAKRHLATLAHFAASNVLLAFDYDGTLAPVASTPARARMRATTRRLLVRLAQRYPCVVISGRRLDEVARLLDGVPVWYVFGNFGLEPSTVSDEAEAIVRGWAGRLTEHLSSHRGLVVEEKGCSVTVHYRHVRDKRRALAAIDEVVRALPEARVLPGRLSVSLLPRSGPDKGVALQQARRLFTCQTAIYVGDDDTDEDAFSSDGPERLLSIRVGTAGASRAGYRLKTQADVDTLLRALIALRPVRYQPAARPRALAEP